MIWSAIGYDTTTSPEQIQIQIPLVRFAVDVL